ncbi:Agamous-like MADS-box protein AGL62 [Morella rubra]|uniref:Agamous-like MADS-box protein AGL62 n=1 Tax=Morella rubra TaxID=262757 RepID=A0A6A1V9Y7_9ROSI|nr:Agamous-like MADS-box protein AGL62 [Morella rubra]
MVRRSKGRQKIRMEKMESESNLQVTFSKRRSGLFKKASELCTLCGAEIAIIVFSPGKKAFSFGHPSVEPILERFLTRKPPQDSGTLQLIEAHRNVTLRELNVQLTQVTSQLEAERKHGEELKRMRKASQEQRWWEAPIEKLGLPQLQQLKESLEELKKNVAQQSDSRLMIHNTTSPQFFASGSSNQGAVPFDANMPFDTRLLYDARMPFDTSIHFDKKIPYDANITSEITKNNVGFSGNVMPHAFNVGYGRGFF